MNLSLWVIIGKMGLFFVVKVVETYTINQLEYEEMKKVFLFCFVLLTFWCIKVTKPWKFLGGKETEVMRIDKPTVIG